MAENPIEKFYASGSEAVEPSKADQREEKVVTVVAGEPQKYEQLYDAGAKAMPQDVQPGESPAPASESYQSGQPDVLEQFYSAGSTTILAAEKSSNEQGAITKLVGEPAANEGLYASASQVIETKK